MLSNRQLRGIVGEVAIKELLHQLKKDMYLLFLENFRYIQDGTVVQCDFVIFTKKGFFSIEVKNWKCDVFCSDKYYWRVKYQINEEEDCTEFTRSPLVQNAWHVSFLKRITGTDYESIVVFTNNARLHDEPNNVMLASGLKSYLESLPDIYTESEVITEARRLAELSQEFKMSLGRSAYTW